MKVVIFSDWFVYYCVELANALSNLGCDILFVYKDHNFEIGEDLTKKEFLEKFLNKKIKKIGFIPTYKNARNFNNFLEIYKAIKHFNPDILHFQDTTDFRYLLLSLLFPKNKIICTIHDVYQHPGDEYRVDRRLVKRLFRKSIYYFICHGEKLKQELSLQLGNKNVKIFVLPHGVLNFFERFDNKKKSIQFDFFKENKIFILFFGRMQKYKGLDYLIKAEKLLSKKYNNYKIIIAGKGNDLDKEKLKYLKSRKNFIVLNRFIKNEEVGILFRNSDIVVLPYIEASQSGIIPIAYQYGKPVIATDVGSIKEVIENGKTGVLVKPKDEYSLSEALGALIKNEELRREMGANAKKKADNELSWSNIGLLTKGIYTQMIIWNKHEER